MAYFTGQTGAAYYSGTSNTTPTQKIAKIRNWSLQANVNTNDVTTLGDFATSNVPTLKSATGSAELFYYTLEAGETGITASTILAKVLKTGAIDANDRIALELRIDNTRYFRFNAWITSASIGSTTGEVTKASINFTMDGDYTVVAL